MSLLPALGECEYNGHVFDETTQTVSLEVRPVQDAAGRTIVYCVYAITLLTRITATNPPALDSAVKLAVERLTKQGGKLVYNSRGAGALSINTGRVRDVVWGPVPKIVAVKPLGGGCAVNLTWSVEVHIPTCGDARFEFAPMEYCTRLDFDVDRSGYTTRTYSGFLRVPMTRRGVENRTLPDSVDEYREKINPPMIPGFRRVPGRFTIDESKTRLDFSIVDEQMGPNIPPPGVIDVKADHQIGNTAGQLAKWTGTLNATYELARGTPASVARDHFFALARDRVRATIQDVFGGKKCATIPVQFTMAEPDIYGRTVARFGLTYAVVGATLRDILKAGSLWRPAPDSDWRKWSLSMAVPLGPRGTAKLTFRPNDDAIVDLCRPAKVEGDQDGGYTDVVLRSGKLPPDLFPDPDAETSWIDYKIACRFEADSGVVVLKALPTKPLKAEQSEKGVWDPELASMPRKTAENLPPLPIGDVAGRIENDTTGVQQRVDPTVYVFITGFAFRSVYDIPCPTLTDVEGMTPIPCNRTDRGEGFWSGIVSSNDKGPVIGARWNLRYVLPGVPKNAPPVLPNPLEGS